METKTYVKFLIVSGVALILSFESLYAGGAANWQLGGNDGNNPNAVDGTNNILGTEDAIPLRFITDNTEDLTPYAVFSL